MQRLVLFDLDHTLLNGDSDVLWCEYLIEQGILNRAEFAARNSDMEARYRAGTVGAHEFANFYASTLAGRTPAQWQSLRESFLTSCISPRISSAAHAQVKFHQDAGDLVVMTTATNRFIAELTAAHLNIEHLIATELEQEQGLTNSAFTGRATGVLNMREGKPVRLAIWLAQRGKKLIEFESTAYSDSINDLPLLECATQAIAVDPDPRLSAVAIERCWKVISLH
jgi:HAD superfamily hydrolase (TIGR01490 family)